MAKTFREWSIEQRWLLPPSVEELVPANHVAHFVRELVRDQLDLSEIFAAYDEERGAPPFHPTMMAALLLYALAGGVAHDVKAEQNDAPQLPPMLAQIRANTGRQAEELSADNGYFSEANLRELKKRRVRGYIAAGRTKHGNTERSKKKRPPRSALALQMAARVRRGGHRSRYRLRKQIVEPVNTSSSSPRN
jgi:hypothetical protein